MAEILIVTESRRHGLCWTLTKHWAHGGTSRTTYYTPRAVWDAIYFWEGPVKFRISRKAARAAHREIDA